MGSDEDYAAFLEKANQDTGASQQVQSSSTGNGGFAKTKAADSEVPGHLKGIETFYQSETDEPFEPVALKYGKDFSSLDAGKFGELIGHEGEVESVKLDEWNVKNHYKEIVDAVKKAGDKGEVKVFRVEHGSTRCEYYVVGLSKEGVIVGVKAKAVES